MSEYFDLGDYSLKVTTESPEAQTWFDRGLAWCYGFNHDEAIACFTKALAADAGLAIAHWGIAYAAGPNYNKPWEAFDAEDLAKCHAITRDQIEQALALAPKASALERALIRALEARCPASPPADLATLNDAYAVAMHDVYAAFPGHPDVATFYAESMMNRTTWKLWDLKTGKHAEGADTAKILEVLDRGLRDNDAEGRNYENAKAVLRMRVEREQDGWARLHFLPEIHHGEALLRPVAGEFEWTHRRLPIVEPLYDQQFSLSLNLGESAVVTVGENKPGTVGQSFFRSLDQAGRLQRLLVVRVTDMQRLSPVYSR